MLKALDELQPTLHKARILMDLQFGDSDGCSPPAVRCERVWGGPLCQLRGVPEQPVDPHIRVIPLTPRSPLRGPRDWQAGLDASRLRPTSRLWFIIASQNLGKTSFAKL